MVQAWGHLGIYGQIVISDIWSYCIYGQLSLDKIAVHITDPHCICLRNMKHISPAGVEATGFKSVACAELRRVEGPMLTFRPKASLEKALPSFLVPI